ncbi:MULTISPECIES: helix-turn-helix domain-containing protein [unclassified Agromyces]|uniref:helix-turn-helix domain-containing protein n=1 Tax=unclassified Agromyces TaxID=2639701 RepID=UPI003014A615
MGRLIEFPQAEPPRATRPLWRHALGEVLREERLDQDRILTEVAATAGVSPQYLSEVERGRKEASSEVLGAVSDALGLDLADVVGRVAGRLGARTAARPGARTTAPEHARVARPDATPAAPRGVPPVMIDLAEPGLDVRRSTSASPGAAGAEVFLLVA